MRSTLSIRLAPSHRRIRMAAGEGCSQAEPLAASVRASSPWECTVGQMRTPTILQRSVTLSTTSTTDACHGTHYIWLFNHRNLGAVGDLSVPPAVASGL